MVRAPFRSGDPPPSLIVLQNYNCSTKGLFGNIGSMREYRRGVSTGNQERRQMARTKPWEVSEEVLERAQPLLPERKPHPRRWRPPRDVQQILCAILYLMRTS